MRGGLEGGDVSSAQKRLGQRETYTAASSVGMLFSQRKNAAMRKMEMMRGASTSADAQPDPDPLVIANMNRISATEIRQPGGEYEAGPRVKNTHW